MYTGVLTHPATDSLHIERFCNLESLHLKTPNCAYWALNAKAVAYLAPLTKLKELVLAFSPCCKREERVTLEEFSALTSLVYLSVTLVPFRGWEPGWNVSLSTKLAGEKHPIQRGLYVYQALHRYYYCHTAITSYASTYVQVCTV